VGDELFMGGVCLRAQVGVEDLEVLGLDSLHDVAGLADGFYDGIKGVFADDAERAGKVRDFGYAPGNSPGEDGMAKTTFAYSGRELEFTDCRV
jgi:hypothetical protein